METHKPGKYLRVSWVSVVEAGAHCGRRVDPVLTASLLFCPGSDFPGMLLGARVDSPAKQSLTQILRREKLGARWGCTLA